MKKRLFLTLVCIFLLSACSLAAPGAPTAVPTSVPTSSPAPTVTGAPTFTLSSPAFANGEAIPALYSCHGRSISPPLAWNEPPAGTKTFALIVDDPDAPGVFVHWIVYDIPADRRGLPEDVAKQQELEDGMYQGLSGGAVFGYVGLCPPGQKHHYSFRLYALDTQIEKKKGVARTLLQDAMQGHILAESDLMGTYQP